MIDKIKVTYIQFTLMPFLLRWITIVFILMGIFGFLSIIFPISTYSINNEIISYEEIWKSGYAFVFLLMSLFILTLGYGFLYAKNWSRYLVLLYLLLSPIYVIFKSEDIFNTWNVISVYLIVLIPVWYLFKKKSVVSYFSGTPNKSVK
ncbi:hypothetical protein [Arcobacter arenosus]|uniref:hypothetical protein n=1 Tax=Arcobacter arenosus TaxID=2576037 RepID=UPI003BA98DE7